MVEKVAGRGIAARWQLETRLLLRVDRSAFQVPMTLSSEEAKQVITKDSFALCRVLTACTSPGLNLSWEELKVANIEELLTDWQDEPIGTASIGQVYKAWEESCLSLSQL